MVCLSMKLSVERLRLVNNVTRTLKLLLKTSRNASRNRSFRRRLTRPSKPRSHKPLPNKQPRLNNPTSQLPAVPERSEISDANTRSDL